MILAIDSLYDLKLIYEAATLFAHRMSEFKHSDRKYLIEGAIKKHILNKLGSCIATEKNFQNRLFLIDKIAERDNNKNYYFVNKAGR